MARQHKNQTSCQSLTNLHFSLYSLESTYSYVKWSQARATLLPTFVPVIIIISRGCRRAAGAEVATPTHFYHILMKHVRRTPRDRCAELRRPGRPPRHRTLHTPGANELEQPRVSWQSAAIIRVSESQGQNWIFSKRVAVLRGFQVIEVPLPFASRLSAE